MAILGCHNKILGKGHAIDSTTLNHVIQLQNQKNNDIEDEEYFAVLTLILSATAAAQYYTMNFFKVPHNTWWKSLDEKKFFFI
jgi:hypothetical protein